MLELLKGYVGETAAPLVFLVLFLVIGGAALWLTPRLAKWLDEQRKQNSGYYDGMMEQPPEEESDSSEEK